MACCQNQPTSVEQIKNEITVLTEPELNEVTAFLFELRHRRDEGYLQDLQRCATHTDKANWLTPEEFERQLQLQ
jgi:hypothetical protein